MNSYIKGVGVFKDNTENGKRVLPLSRGLNIISGNSKTGKSAIMDIIDWCLCSDECTIPKGVITHFTKIYFLILVVKHKALLLAREDQQKGKNRIFVKEISTEINIEDIQYEEFEEKYFSNRKNALNKINDIINLTVDRKIFDLDFDTKMPKTGIRDTLPYMLQYQEIVANKTKLFYIEPQPNHFPVLAGWYGPDYYIVQHTIERLKHETKRLQTEQRNSITNNLPLINNLRESLHIYCNLIGKKFNENWNVEEIIHQIKNLEEFKKEESSNNLVERQYTLEKKIEYYNTQRLQLNNQIAKIKSFISNGKDYETFLKKYEQRTKYFCIQKEYTCPICNKPNEELSGEAIQIIEAENWLQNELVSFPTNETNFKNSIKALNQQVKDIEKECAPLVAEYKRNKTTLDKVIKEKNLNEQKQKAYWKVHSELEIFEDRKIIFDEKRLIEKQAELDKYEEKYKSYTDINDKYVEEKRIIEDRMSLIIEKVDFEHKPPELNFELNPKKEDCFKLYHRNHAEERIFMRQMGSASNALACHLGLFLSLLNYFTSQPESKVPSILFFDQPSQVYFPSGADNTDVEKVGQIYQTILDEIKEIQKNTGITPQIIVADHIKDIGEENVKLYEDYFKADWRDGRAFI